MERFLQEMRQAKDGRGLVRALKRARRRGVEERELWRAVVREAPVLDPELVEGALAIEEVALALFRRPDWSEELASFAAGVLCGKMAASRRPWYDVLRDERLLIALTEAGSFAASHPGAGALWGVAAEGVSNRVVVHRILLRLPGLDEEALLRILEQSPEALSLRAVLEHPAAGLPVWQRAMERFAEYPRLVTLLARHPRASGEAEVRDFVRRRAALSEHHLVDLCRMAGGEEFQEAMERLVQSRPEEALALLEEEALRPGQSLSSSHLVALLSRLEGEGRERLIRRLPELFPASPPAVLSRTSFFSRCAP